MAIYTACGTTSLQGHGMSGPSLAMDFRICIRDHLCKGIEKRMSTQFFQVQAAVTLFARNIPPSRCYGN